MGKQELDIGYIRSIAQDALFVRCKLTTADTDLNRVIYVEIQMVCRVEGVCCLTEYFNSFHPSVENMTSWKPALRLDCTKIQDWDKYIEGLGRITSKFLQEKPVVAVFENRRFEAQEMSPSNLILMLCYRDLLTRLTVALVRGKKLPAQLRTRINGFLVRQINEWSRITDSFSV